MFTPGTVKCAQLGDFINMFTSGTVKCAQLGSFMNMFTSGTVKCAQLGDFNEYVHLGDCKLRPPQNTFSFGVVHYGRCKM